MESDKSSIRRQMRKRRRCVDAAENQRCSELACQRLAELGEVAHAEALAVYAATDGEIDVGLLIGPGRAYDGRTLLPRFESVTGRYRMVPVGDLATDTVVGAYGILEPDPGLPAVSDSELLSEAVTWLIPGVAFDLKGNRLGRGAGYYDRMLDGACGPKIGVAFEWQMLPAVPAEAHDVRMDVIVTDRRTLRF